MRVRWMMTIQAACSIVRGPESLEPHRLNSEPPCARSKRSVADIWIPSAIRNSEDIKQGKRRKKGGTAVKASRKRKVKKRKGKKVEGKNEEKRIME